MCLGGIGRFGGGGEGINMKWRRHILRNEGGGIGGGVLSVKAQHWLLSLAGLKFLFSVVDFRNMYADCGFNPRSYDIAGYIGELCGGKVGERRRERVFVGARWVARRYVAA